MKNDQDLSDINELIITGLIVSKIQHYKQKCVFTLKNSNGRFFVQWLDPTWKPQQGQQVIVRGSIFSAQWKNRDTAKIQADAILLLQQDNVQDFGR